MIFLAGDIGGTHTRLMLAETTADGWHPLAMADYPSGEFATFDDVLALFLETERWTPRIMVLAVAGPVSDERVKVTNLPWQLDARALAKRFAIPQVRLLNDFEAQGHALPVLAEGDLVTLQAGEPQADGVMALIGAGTGLGMAQVVPADGDWRVLPGEGGHMDLAPRNDLELQLWRHLRASLGRVSVESVVSGPGIERIHRWLCERDNLPARALSAPAISEAALARPDGPERQALRLFVQWYGAVAGNLALIDLPRGGLYVGGGIAPAILPLLQAEGFVENFCDKEPMRALLQTIPVHVIVREQPGVVGAARVARQMACARA